MKKIRKAVFPVAGLGTRFLPATKASPKEMLPIVDKPLIQYAVEEAIQAGLTEMIFVTSSSKRAIEDHFDSNYELEMKLEESKRFDLLKQVTHIIPENVSCSYVRQRQPRGLGDAILSAQHAIGDEPFVVILADDLIETNSPYLSEMIKFYDENHASVIAVQQIPQQDTEKYGIVELSKNPNRFERIRSIVEKPHPEVAPSNLAVIGRYILTPRIFDQLQSTVPGAKNEVQLTDAIAALLDHEPIYAYQFQGKRYDCGSKLGYLMASVSFGLKHSEIGAEFQKMLKEFQF